jgi:hypothetical protein
MVLAGDDRIKLSETEQLERMKSADADKMNAKECLPKYGIKGTNIFNERLDYISFNNIWVVPTYHMLLFGVVKSFWTLAF